MDTIGNKDDARKAIAWLGDNYPKLSGSLSRYVCGSPAEDNEAARSKLNAAVYETLDADRRVALHDHVHGDPAELAEAAAADTDARMSREAAEAHNRPVKT